MMTFLIIIAAVIVTALLAFAIVKLIPQKLHWIIMVLLVVAAGYLVYKINFEITKPIAFNKEKKVRYAKVIDKMRIIRDAEVAHKKVTGKYTANGDELIKFIETAKFPITQTRNVPKKIHVGGGIYKEIEEKVVDTVGYEEVIKSFKGRDYKNMLSIPGTDKKFKIEVGVIKKMADVTAPVFQVQVDKAEILKGMDYNLIKQEKEAIGGEEIKGAFLRVGSLSEVSEDGNWPPFYDKEYLNGKKENKE
ncbi:MAG: hypothetical protein KGV44_01025 [Flavobacteriaceae bacterium]|nr:hypothetical protein [Flavobacteriaceae bacterium]